MKRITLPSLITLVAIALVIAGLVIPPPGVIDPSVLTAVGLLLGFKALAMLPSLVKRNGKASVQIGNTSLSVSGNADTGDDIDPC